MGRKLWAIATIGVLAVVGAACAPPPNPNPPLVVTTTANTFDGVCDDDCSLRDAIAVHNTRPLDPTGVANRITLPAGTFDLSVDEAIVISRRAILLGAGVGNTVLNLTGSSVTAPAGVFDTHAAVIFNGMTVRSDSPTPNHVLANCGGASPWTVTLINSSVLGLAGAIATCDAAFVSTFVGGPRAVIAPRSLTASASTLPFDGTPMQLVNFSLVSSVLTGPSTAEGTSQDGLLNIQPRSAGATITGGITGSRGERIGLRLGGEVDGGVVATMLNSSFGLDGSSGPLSLRTAEGSTLRTAASTIHGGGTGGALQGRGTFDLQSTTVAWGQRAVGVDSVATVNVRTSVLSALGASTCNRAVNLVGHNAVVGSSCGTPGPTDQVVADQAALELGPLAANGATTPARSFLPASTSPLVDAIPTGGQNDQFCPVGTDGQGRSIDQRGQLRPVGPACDVGAVERRANDPAP